VAFTKGHYKKSVLQRSDAMRILYELHKQEAHKDYYPPLLGSSFSSSIGHLGLHLIHIQSRELLLPGGARTIIEPKSCGNTVVFDYLSIERNKLKLSLFDDSNALWNSPLSENLLMIKAHNGFIDLYEMVETYGSKLISLGENSQAKFRDDVIHKMPRYWENCQVELRSHGLNVEDKFFVLHVRDPLENRNLRSASINNYVGAINYLIKQGYKVVRIGTFENRIVDFQRKGFIDLSALKESSECLLYLLLSCVGFIGTTSGPKTLSLAFGVPTLVTNLTSVARNSFSFPEAMYLPKILSGRHKNIELEDYFQPEVGFGEMSRGYLHRRGLALRENNRFEILAATEYFMSKIMTGNKFRFTSQAGKLLEARINNQALTYGELVPTFLEKYS
jgi:putative glycosyltransferase (TIGR04372 family)